MSSETDQPRQRTVAELLAAHGGETATTGRRRRRREADEPDGGTTASAEGGAAAPQADHAAPRPAPASPQPVAPQQAAPRWSPSVASAPPRPAADLPARNGQANGTPAPMWPRPADARPAEPRQDDARPAEPRPAPPVRDRPTDVIPRVREQEPVEEFTSRFPARPAAAEPDDGGPSTMVGVAPVGAESWHRVRTGSRSGGMAIDGGPPLMGRPPEVDDGPAGLGGDQVDRDHRGGDDSYVDSYDDVRYDAETNAEFASPPARQRRLGRAGGADREASAPGWGAVIVQWIGGALGGAVLWVLFRFLWRNLPVVAVAASAIVTIGLVLIVRALLHNSDKRTTIFAVLVGLLLTVSPAILVLMGR